MEVKYPNIKVQLTGNDGNAYAVLGNVRRAMRRAKVETPEIEEFMKEAMSFNYDHLLRTCCKWVSVS